MFPHVCELPKAIDRNTRLSVIRYTAIDRHQRFGSRIEEGPVIILAVQDTVWRLNRCLDDTSSYVVTGSEKHGVVR